MSNYSQELIDFIDAWDNSFTGNKGEIPSLRWASGNVCKSHHKEGRTYWKRYGHKMRRQFYRELVKGALRERQPITRRIW